MTNTVVGFAEESFRERVEARRAEPKVQEALKTLGHVWEAQRVYDWFRDRIVEVETPFNELIARAEAQRLEWPLEWTPEMKHRVEDARENLIGIHVEMNALINDYFARHYENQQPPRKERFKK